MNLSFNITINETPSKLVLVKSDDESDSEFSERFEKFKDTQVMFVTITNDQKTAQLQSQFFEPEDREKSIDSVLKLAVDIIAARIK